MARRRTSLPEVKSIQVGEKTYYYIEQSDLRYFYRTFVVGKRALYEEYEDYIDTDIVISEVFFNSGRFWSNRFGVEEFISIWVQEGTELFKAKFPELVDQDF